MKNKWESESPTWGRWRLRWWCICCWLYSFWRVKMERNIQYMSSCRARWVARWITTFGPSDLAAALKSRLIYYYVLLLLFGYLYPYNIMPREIPRSRPDTLPRFPQDQDLVSLIGHNFHWKLRCPYKSLPFPILHSIRPQISYDMSQSIQIPHSIPNQDFKF